MRYSDITMIRANVIEYFKLNIHLDPQPVEGIELSWLLWTHTNLFFIMTHLYYDGGWEVLGDRLQLKIPLFQVL